MERAMGNLLRAGVALAALIVLIAGIRFTILQPNARPDYSKFRGEPQSLRQVSAVVGGAAHGDPLSQAQFGILLLIGTPAARVVFALCAFAVRRDWSYVVVSAVILGVLIYSFTSSGA